MVEWRDCVGYEGRYSVSSDGRIYSHLFNRELNPHKNKLGYKKIYITDKCGVRKGKAIHRLVAMAFCDGYEEGLEVNHKDAVRDNNRADNLEWVTRTENVRDTVLRGTHSNKEAVAKLRRRVRRLSMDGEILSEYASIREAVEKYSIDQGSLSKVCLGQRHSAGGYKWEYVS